MRLAPILTIIVLAAGAAGGYAYWRQEQASRVPPGLARANGRIEVERVDVATKYAGRIAELRVDEGELKLAEAELRRTAELARTFTATQAELDRRTAQRGVSSAALQGAKVAIE